MTVGLPQPTRVLHVDDDPEFAELTATFLERDDDRFSVETVAGAGEALDRVTDDPPDCIVSDYNMPGMDGIELLRTVREGYPELPFVLYTGKGSEAVASEAVSAGVTDYLQKRAGPEQYELLGNRIRNAVRARTRERRFQALVEESNDIISVVDAEGRYTYQSPSLERILGHNPEETIGDEAWGYIHPDDRERVREQFAEWVANPDITGVIRYRARDADGCWRWMEARGNNQLDNPAVEGYVVNSRDITEQREREQELRTVTRQYQTLLEQFPDGAVYLFDDDLQYVRARGEELEAVGLSPEDVEGSTPHELFPADIADKTVESFRAALSGEETTLEQEYEGEHYRIRTVPVETGDTIEYGMAVAENVTEQTNRRRRLQQQNERLEEFASIVSHDLRNPLQVARGRVELARETGDSTHLSDALDAFDRSEALIEDLLTLARDGDTTEEVEPVRLDSLAERAWGTVETGAATLEVDTDRTVPASRSRLRQLFENLFGNAVEHAGPDVTVTVAALDNGFSVADDGPGIPPAEREAVFDAGYSTNDRGTGFGLRIVEEVVADHDWTLHLTEGTDGGARFEITGVDTAV